MRIRVPLTVGLAILVASPLATVSASQPRDEPARQAPGAPMVRGDQLPELHQRIQETDDPAERERLLREHEQTMEETMEMVDERMAMRERRMEQMHERGEMGPRGPRPN